MYIYIKHIPVHCHLSIHFSTQTSHIYAISTQALYIYTVANTSHTFSLGRTIDWFVAPDFAAFC